MTSDMICIKCKIEILDYLQVFYWKCSISTFYDIGYPEGDLEWLKHDALLV